MGSIPPTDNWFGIRAVWEIGVGGATFLWGFFKVQSLAKDAHTKIADLRQDMNDRLASAQRQRAEDLANSRREIDGMREMLSEIRSDVKTILGRRD